MVFYIFGFLLCMIYLTDITADKADKLTRLENVCIALVWPFFAIGYIILKRDYIIYALTGETELLEAIEIPEDLGGAAEMPERGL